MNYEWVGFSIILVLAFILCVGPLSAFFPRRLRNLIAFVFLTRVVGVLLRHWVIYGFYDGGGDATDYYRYGLHYATYIRNFDFSVLQQITWQYGRLWGTAAITMISSFVLSVIGPTQRGEFLVFSMLSLWGLLLFCKAFEKNFPHSNLRNYAKWILLWPSIWFWSSSVGKDALILMATGFVVYGYTGMGNRIHWISMLIGISLASVIRPHVGGVMVVSIAIAHWISPRTRWTTLHWLQGAGIVILTAIVIQKGLTNLGLYDVDVENIREYVELVSVRSSQGGSKVYAPGMTLLGIPLAFVNMLFRPFPWEVSHPLMAAASLELIVFWYIVWKRRHAVAKLLLHWRSNRLLRLALPLIFLYVLMLGMAIGNLGIIARQRIHVMPLLFIWLEAVPLTKAIQKTQFRGKFPSPIPAAGFQPRPLH